MAVMVAVVLVPSPEQRRGTTKKSMHKSMNMLMESCNPAEAVRRIALEEVL